MTHRILLVITSHDRLGDTGNKTGFWLEELAAPYYVFRDAGADITLASPAGGQPPLDPTSAEPDHQTEATRRFNGDDEALARLAATRPLAEVDPSDFDAVFYPGGHGPLWDLVDDADSIRLIERYRAAGKPIAAVCHAPIVLVNARDPAGEPVVKGHRVTGFADAEEEAVGLSAVVPRLVEDSLKALGGEYSRAEAFAPHVVEDGGLITGQNPASSAPAAELLLKALDRA